MDPAGTAHGNPASTDGLHAFHYETALLRLARTEDDTVSHGTLVNLDGVMIGQFRSVDQIPDIVRGWLVELGHAGAADATRTSHDPRTSRSAGMSEKS